MYQLSIAYSHNSQSVPTVSIIRCPNALAWSEKVLPTMPPGTSCKNDQLYKKSPNQIIQNSKNIRYCLILTFLVEILTRCLSERKLEKEKERNNETKKKELEREGERDREQEVERKLTHSF